MRSISLSLVKFYRKMIDLPKFISDLRHAFGESLQLPIAVWRSDDPQSQDILPPHCIFGVSEELKQGQAVSLSADTLHCGGGKLYCGFMPMNQGIANFVSHKERYKATPEMVHSHIESLNIAPADKRYINLARIDTLASLEGVDGIFFIAPPDVISGLCAWAFFDNNSPDAVCAHFASGCCANITSIISENSKGGRSTFLGMFDISVRIHIAPDELSFAIPTCRLEEMAGTLRECCLWDAPAWERLRSRMA